MKNKKEWKNISKSLKNGEFRIIDGDIGKTFDSWGEFVDYLFEYSYIPYNHNGDPEDILEEIFRYGKFKIEGELENE